MLFIKLTTFRKTSLLLLIVMLILIALPVAALADNTITPDTGGNILDSVKQAQAGDTVGGLTASASKAGNSVVTFLRTVAIIVSVVMFIVVAYALLFSPNSKTIADMKGRVGALVLALIIAFMAEQIVGTLMSWFGFKA